jgi:hypothetical protein
MEKVGFEKGLIRYTSEETISEGKKSTKIPKRTIAYGVIGMIIIGVWIGVFMNRTDTKTTLLRAPGSQYTLSQEGVSNLYTYKIFNKTNKEIKAQMNLDYPKGDLKFIGTEHLVIPPAGMLEGSVMITIPEASLQQRKTDIKLTVHQGSQLLEQFTTTFMAPQQ